MTNYDAGRRFEWKMRDEMMALGAYAVRSAGSKSKIDLIGFFDGVVLLVQCKRDGKISPLEREVLVQVAARNPAVTLPVLATTEGWFLLTGPGPKDRTSLDLAALVEGDG